MSGSAHGAHGSEGLGAHRAAAATAVPTAVLTVSDTRTLETDTGGALAAELLAGALADDGVRALVVTGGTGVAPRDVTPESVEPLLERIVPGFGELFRALSFTEIGSAALLSRALAGLARGRVVFVVPGSRGAVRLALERLVLPEIGHLAAEAVKTR